MFLESTIYSQIANEGLFKISASTTVSFQDEYTNKITASFINNGDLNLEDNFINNGTITSISGTTFFNNSNSELQLISGTSEQINFYNLSIDNDSGITQNLDATVSNNLSINLGNSLTIAPSIKLTVNGIISNLAGNDGLVLKSDDTGTASIIHYTDNISATVERYISGVAEDWHFLSSPVSNQTIAGSSWVPSGTYGNGTGYDLYAWDESTPCWVYQLNTTTSPNWPTVHPSANFAPGKGYLYSVQQLNPTFDFKGTLNNGTISYPLTANSISDESLIGFNLIGNPYPSAIDWKASSGWTRSNLLDSGGGYDMWIWNPTANNYGVFNSIGTTGTNNVTQYIPSTQGFFVRAETNANITMTNDLRLNTSSNYWMKTGSNNEVSNLKVKIQSESGLGYDEVLFQFGHLNSTPGATKLFSSVKTAPSVFTKMDLDKLSIKYLTNTMQNPSVPLSFIPGADGNYKLNINLKENNFEYLILEDKIEKNLHNLLEEPEYTFYGSVNNHSDRFILHFTSKNLVIEDDRIEAPIYYNGAYIVVDLSSVKNNTEVEVYTILGKRLVSKSLKGKRAHTLSISSKKQLYIVTLKNEKKTKIKKIAVL
jgi:hypothetical protein